MSGETWGVLGCNWGRIGAWGAPCNARAAVSRVAAASASLSLSADERTSCGLCACASIPSSAEGSAFAGAARAE